MASERNLGCAQLPEPSPARSLKADSPLARLAEMGPSENPGQGIEKDGGGQTNGRGALAFVGFRWALWVDVGSFGVRWAQVGFFEKFSGFAFRFYPNCPLTGLQSDNKRSGDGFWHRGCYIGCLRITSPSTFGVLPGLILNMPIWAPTAPPTTQPSHPTHPTH